MQDNSKHIAQALTRMTFGEQRRFWQLVRTQRIPSMDAVRVVERDRNRAAIAHTDLRDVVREQTGRRTVVSALVRVG